VTEPLLVNLSALESCRVSRGQERTARQVADDLGQSLRVAVQRLRHSVDLRVEVGDELEPTLLRERTEGADE